MGVPRHPSSWISPIGILLVQAAFLLLVLVLIHRSGVIRVNDSQFYEVFTNSRSDERTSDQRTSQWTRSLMPMAENLPLLFHRFSIVRFNDSRLYESLSRSGLAGLLGHCRTPGYPLFLRLVRQFSPSLNGLPYFQFWLHSLAVILFFAGLRALGFRDKAGLWVSSLLLYSPITWFYTKAVLSEVSGEAMVIITLGWLFYSIRHPTRARWQFATSFFAFLTYTIRPLYIFLLLWIPMAFVLWQIECPAGLSPKRVLKAGLAYLFIMLLPFTLFSSARWVSVRSFGLASCASIWLVGYVGQLIEPSMINALTPVEREIAELALTKRRDPKWIELVNSTGGDPDALYMSTIYDQFLPAAQEVLSRHPELRSRATEMVRVNQTLTSLCAQVIWKKPFRFLGWFVRHFLYSFGQLILVNPAFLLLCLFAAITRAFKQTPLRVTREEAMFLTLGVTFAMFAIFVICSCEIPEARYLMAASVFLPLYPAFLISRLWVGD